MKHQVFLWLAMLSLLAGSACQSSKVAYGNSYYFKATPRPAPTQLSASTVPIPVASQTVALSLSLPAVTGSQRTVAKPVLSRREARQERRAHRKAVRKQLKQWLKTSPTNTYDLQESQRLEGWSKAGVITGAGALVLLGIGLLASIGFLIGLGAVLLAIAVVLVLIDTL